MTAQLMLGAGVSVTVAVVAAVIVWALNSRARLKQMLIHTAQALLEEQKLRQAEAKNRDKMQYMLDAQEALFRQMVEGRLSRDQLNQLRSGLRNGASSPTP